MEIEKCKKIVTSAVNILTSLTNLNQDDIRLESFEQTHAGDYSIGLSINEMSVFYNRSRSYYVVELYQEDLTLKKITRKDYE